MSQLIRPLYPVKGPFVKSKSEFGFVGVLEYDDVKDTVRCHECGEWFQSLGSHLWKKHEMHSSTYKMKYGLLLSMPLCGRKTSARLRLQMTDSIQQAGRHKLGGRSKWKKSKSKRQHGTKSEAWKNKHGLCDLQMKTRYESIKQTVGHMPTTQEIRKYDHALLSAIERRHGTLNIFRTAVGDKQKTAQEYQMLSEASLIEALVKKSKALGRIPVVRDFQKASKGYPQASTYLGRFGSWKHALSLAGLRST